MTQDSFTFSINSNDSAFQQHTSFYKIHIDISKNRLANMQWKVQSENCLECWYESLASAGFEEGRKRKNLCVADTHQLNICMAFTPLLEPIPCIICFAKCLMNILGFFDLPTWQIKPQLIQVIKMYMFCVKGLRRSSSHLMWVETGFVRREVLGVS